MTPTEVSEYIRLRCRQCADCLFWYTKAKTENRRRHPMGRLPEHDKPLLMRRALYEAEKGPIRKGYSLIPKCGDDCCIEPEHQKQITHNQQSVAGSEVSKESPTRGLRVSASRRKQGLLKLTPELVREIRASNETGLAIAQRLGVHNKTISDVRLYKTWADVDNPFGKLAA